MLVIPFINQDRCAKFPPWGVGGHQVGPVSCLGSEIATRVQWRVKEITSSSEENVIIFKLTVTKIKILLETVNKTVNLLFKSKNKFDLKEANITVRIKEHVFTEITENFLFI